MTQNLTEDIDESGGEAYRLVYEALPEGVLIQRPMLGIPGMGFILIELGVSDDDVLEFTTTSGGGLEDPGKVGEILEMLSESLVGKTQDDLEFRDSSDTIIQVGLGDEEPGT